MKKLISLILILSTIGCSPRKPFDLTSGAETRVTVYLAVYEEEATFSRRFYHVQLIKVDGQTWGRARDRVYTTFQLSPGTHVLSLRVLKSGSGLIQALANSAIGDETLKKLAVDLEQDTNYLIEAQPITFKEGLLYTSPDEWEYKITKYSGDEIPVIKLNFVELARETNKASQSDR